MDIEEIGRRYQGQITFWGEIDRQYVMPFRFTQMYGVLFIECTMRLIQAMEVLLLNLNGVKMSHGETWKLRLKPGYLNLTDLRNHEHA